MMLPDQIFSSFQTAAQGLAVQRERINAASRNIANVNTASPADSGRVYSPQRVRTEAPQPEDFKNVLRESLESNSLKHTRTQHFTEGRFERQQVSQKQGTGPSFEIAEEENFRFEYDPNHPDANEEGMVRYPDIDIVEEMSQMVSANRLYEANLSAIEAEKEIIRRSMKI